MTRNGVLLTIWIAALGGLLFPQATPVAQRASTRVERVNGLEAAAREVLVKFRHAPPADLLSHVRSLTDAEDVRTIGRTGVRRLRARALDVPALLRMLSNNPDVEYAEPNYLVHAFTEPADPSFPQLWGLKNVGQAVNGGAAGTAGADIHATQAWDLSTGSTAHVVAVVDTGIDYTHPDLAANVWSAPAPYSVTLDGVTVTCPAGSHGFNTIAMSCNPMDDHNHGTHVSGTIGAAGGNGVGVVGVNWTAQVMGIKFLDATGSGSLADAIKAFEFAIQVKRAFAPGGGANIRVLSNSWGGGGFSQAMLDEINAANDEDMLFVAAAGNNGFSNDILPTYPASYAAPNVIAVAATTNTDSLAYFSNYGATSVHLGAPGLDILSTTIGNTYSFFSGTSMATPHVSGAAALVLSHCAFDTAALKDALVSTAEVVPALASITVSGGRLDVNSAIRACEAPTAPTGLKASAGDAKVTLTWSGGAGATAFNVKRSLTSGGPYTALASNVKGRTYVDTAVTNGTTYYYVVSASNAVGETGDSNEASATPKSPSDLIITAFSAPQMGGVGLPMALTETIRNQGGGTSVPTTTRFYLTTNGAIAPTSVALDGVHAVPSLPPGGTSTASIAAIVPAGVTAGTYYLVAKADADNVENETSESNNTSTKLVWIGPDLIITSLTGPTAAAAGATIVIGDTVRNQGGGATSTTATRFYLSADSVLDGGDVLLAAGRSVPGLAPGASSTGSTSLLIPANTATGSYYLIAKADGDNTEPETQEWNNTYLKLLQVGGDLVVSGLTAPSAIGAGSTIVVTDTTSNQGSSTVAASVTRFYLSRNVTLDGSATALDGGRMVPELGAGAASTGSTSLAVPSTIGTGNYYLIAKADADNAIAETQEANNTVARLVAVGGDLTISVLTVPSKGGIGGTIVVSDTTANIGAGTVADSQTRFYLSRDALLDASDTPLASRAVGPLAGGTGSTATTTLSLPPTMTVGTYYVIAKADADSTVAETQETNNTTARAITIGPDLTVSVLSVPFTIAAGSTVQITETTLNAGGDASGASTTRFYLSINQVFDPSDLQLAGSHAVPALAGGASSAATTAVTIPATTVPGFYYVFAVADADGAVIEAQENNNSKVVLIWVVANTGQ